MTSSELPACGCEGQCPAEGHPPTGEPVLTGQVLVQPALPQADEPVKFPWEEPLHGGQ
jgi:hypothetical protein